MNQNLTEIVAIIDESGSMGTLVQETITGFNSFINEQKKLPGEAHLTLCLFNYRCRIIENGLDVSRFEGINDSIYRPQGYTALYDAVGSAIDAVGSRLSKTEECDRPGKVIVVIVTDGHENFSKEYTKDSIKSMIDRQTNEYSWEFIYLGANQDAFAVGGGLGIRNNFTYDTSDTVQLYSNVASAAVTNYRATGTVNFNNSK